MLERKDAMQADYDSSPTQKHILVDLSRTSGHLNGTSQLNGKAAEAVDIADPPIDGKDPAPSSTPPAEERAVKPVTPTFPKIDTSLPEALPSTPRQHGKRAGSRQQKEREESAAGMVRERCRQLCLSLFFGEHDSVRSLGFTSSLKGEGKSFLALVTASVLAQDCPKSVTLLECDWEHPSYHEQFGFSPTPGLAEWLRGECHEEDIRYRVSHNLTVVPAGKGNHDAVKLLQRLRQHGLLQLFSRSDELFVVDLPAIVTTAYGSLAASLVESLIVVVRAGATSEAVLSETCKQLKDMPVHGLLLNRVESQIPRWLRQLL